MTCETCPCPNKCRAGIFCEWSASGDPVALAHIRKVNGCQPALTPEAANLPKPEERPCDLSREIIVSRYREDVAWLDQVPAKVFISLYDKGNQPIECSRQVRLERLPNVGREAHTLAYHCWRYYDSLAEWTYSLQGDALTLHAPDILGRLEVPYTRLTSLTETYSATHPSAEIHATDLVEYVGGFRVAYGDARQNHNADRLPPFFYAGAWHHLFRCKAPEQVWFGYGCMYAIPRSAILARPKGFWKWLVEEIAKSPTTEDGWYPQTPLTAWKMESMFYYVLSDPKQYPHRWKEPKKKGCGCGSVDSLVKRKEMIKEKYKR